MRGGGPAAVPASMLLPSVLLCSQRWARPLLHQQAFARNNSSSTAAAGAAAAAAAEAEAAEAVRTAAMQVP